MSMTLNEGSYTQAEQARGTGAPPQRRDGLVRCAIYTRKSTDEGLDQDFTTPSTPNGKALQATS